MKAALIRNDTPVSGADLAIVTKMLADIKFGSTYRASGDVQAMRNATEAMLANPFFRAMPDGVRVESTEVAGLNAEWIHPPEPQRPVLVFFHGGGYVRGSLALGRANAAELALRSGMSVLAVAYAQAPECPFPAAFQDAFKVAEALADMGRPYALVGESAGGGLVFAAAMACRDQGIRAPFAVCGISPFVDLTLSGDSWDFNLGKDIATREMGEEMIALYMGDQARDDWRASPIVGNFAGLAPMQIIVGSHEGLLSEALLVAHRASEAGCEVALEVFEAMPHGFTKYRFAAADLAMARVGDWLAMQAQVVAN